MADALPPPVLERVAAFVADRIGMDFPEGRRGDLARGLRAAATSIGISDPAVLVHRMLDATEPDPEAFEAVVAHLTVGETFFFRDRACFEQIAEWILPDLRSRFRPPRVWSAGCATGEEAYSLAVLLLMAGGVGPAPCVLGTDINARALDRARAGLYRGWSFRGVPDWLRPRFFRRRGPDSWEIADGPRSLVTFTRYNLVEEPLPTCPVTDFDLVLCRNVLMYLSPVAAEKVVLRLVRSLAPGGWLVLGPTEAPALEVPGMKTIQCGDIPFFRKASPSKVHENRRTPCMDLPASRPERRDDEKRETATNTRQHDDAARLAVEARGLADKGRLEEALGRCDAGIGLNRLEPRLHYLRATIHQALGRPLDAIADLQRTTYLDPYHAPAFVMLAALERERGRVLEARRHLASALSILGTLDDNSPMEDAEGMTAGQLRGIVEDLRSRIGVISGAMRRVAG